MIAFSDIEPSSFPAMQDIEAKSNPYPWRQKNLQEAYAQFAHLGGFIKGQLVIFVLYSTVIDEAEIIHLVCDKKYQGRGYACALLTILCQRLRENNIRKLFLEVREGNYCAQALYQKKGFVTVGKRPNYYANGEDALIQQLKL